MNPILAKIITTISKQVTPANRQAFRQALIAGQKIMFDKKTHAHMELVKNPASRQDPARTIANGVAGLVWVMYMESRKTMKPEVMVYSGIVLMAHVLDFAERAYGIQVTNELVAQTTKLLAENLFKKLNVSPEQLQQLINNGAEEIRAYKSGRLTPEMVQEKVQRAGAVMTGGASVVPSSDGAGALPTGGTGVGGGGGNGG